MVVSCGGRTPAASSGPWHFLHFKGTFGARPVESALSKACLVPDVSNRRGQGTFGGWPDGSFPPGAPMTKPRQCPTPSSQRRPSFLLSMRCCVDPLSRPSKRAELTARPARARSDHGLSVRGAGLRSRDAAIGHHRRQHVGPARRRRLRIHPRVVKRLRLSHAGEERALPKRQAPKRRAEVVASRRAHAL